MGRLDGKVAIITGAARGQGAAEARAFAAEGAQVVLTDVLVDEGEATAAEIGDGAVFERHDVSREEEWDAVVSSTIERFGRLDALVNNAAIQINSPIASHALADYEKLVSVNQVGVFLGMRAAVRPMTDAGGGSIVNISSGAGIRATKYMIGYAATKYAVTGMTASAALELARYNIRVNSIHPGIIDTEMINTNTPEATAAMVKLTPLRRLGEVEEIAQVALFLASDESSFMTGAHVPVDGGITA